MMHQRVTLPQIEARIAHLEQAVRRSPSTRHAAIVQGRLADELSGLKKRAARLRPTGEGAAQP